MALRQATIHIVLVAPRQVAVVELIDGEAPIEWGWSPYHSNLIPDLEKRYVFQEGQAEFAQQALERNTAWMGHVYVRE